MNGLRASLILACVAAIVGCEGVSPKPYRVAITKRLGDGTYEIQLRYSETSSGGPCLSEDWFKRQTSYSTNWLYLKTVDGVMTADRLVVTIESGQKEWPYAYTNMQGTISFTNVTMRVRLQQPNYPDGVHMRGYIPYYLNGEYQIVMDSSPNTVVGHKVN